MRVMFVGDVVGRQGRKAVLDLVPRLRRAKELDAVVVNCENIAGGRGVTPEIADELLRSEIDILSSGNHIWHFKEINDYLEQEPRLLRPANYPDAPGSGSYVTRTANGKRLGVILVEGRVFMKNLECPFAAVKRELASMGNVDATLIDVHCEASSEKQAMGWHFDGRVSAVVGTHTHVPTADERILPRGTAFQTDVGMTGPYDSVIGMEAKAAIRRFTTQRFVPYQVASENVIFCGCVIDIDDATGRARSIERIKEPWNG